MIMHGSSVPSIKGGERCLVRRSARGNISLTLRNRMFLYPATCRRHLFCIKSRQGDDDPTSDEGQSDTPTDLSLPPSTISKLREEVFSLDSMFVTSVENYGENGVLFKGNLRGDSEVVYSKLRQKLQDVMGPGYKLFLLTDRDDKPVAVIFPTESTEFQTSELVEAALSVVLSLTAVVTTLNVMSSSALFNAALLTIDFDLNKVQSAIPGTLAALSAVVAHELGHILAAKNQSMRLSWPVPLPAGLGLLGSFGCITRIKDDVPNREVLANVIAPGPLAGFAISLVFVVLGLVLTATGNGGIDLDTDSFRQSLLIGALGDILFGDRLFAASSISCSPLFIAGWAGLIINAINCIPAGELDGGKLFFAIFGRQAASTMNIFSFILLGVGSFINGLALFWLLLVLTIQRGPITPCQNEISDIKDQNIRMASLVALALPLLILMPYPLAPTLGPDALL